MERIYKEQDGHVEFSEEDMIYHLAANSITENTPSKGKREKWFNNLNVGGTKNLLESMEANGVKEMAFISSDMVYGSPRQIPINGLPESTKRYIQSSSFELIC